MPKKNNSEGKPYYTQRNNRIKPGTACNVTSIISALSAAGWPVDKLAPDGRQPEDNLMRFLLTDPMIQAQWKRIDPKSTFPPNEWHALLAEGTNRLIRLLVNPEAPHVVTFSGNANASIIAAVIRAGGAAAVSGLFTLPDGSKLNHMVSVVGVTGDEEASAFILDDPWGDYRSGYGDWDGNDVEMPMKDFLSIVKFPDSPRKMAHLVRRYA